jgi:hypothetical protein
VGVLVVPITLLTMEMAVEVLEDSVLVQGSLLPQAQPTQLLLVLVALEH